MKQMIFAALLVTTATGLAYADSAALLQQYTQQGASAPSAQRGRAMWQQAFTGSDEFSERSCASCHTSDLARAGKHVKTGKAIEPMSPQVNPERLSDNRKVEKWLLRNCKWTLGRECSVQEKADFLAYIQSAEMI
jgi:mono/diheme cytochrome c family protein